MKKAYKIPFFVTRIAANDNIGFLRFDNYEIETSD